MYNDKTHIMNMAQVKFMMCLTVLGKIQTREMIINRENKIL